MSNAAFNIKFALATTLSMFTVFSAPAETFETISPVYFVDRTYASMEGPYSIAYVQIDAEETPYLVWITGVRASVLDENLKPLSTDFFCHANVDIRPERHKKEFDSTKQKSSRLFTLSQGNAELHFPNGFGIPVMSNEMLAVSTQALNHNLSPSGIRIRVKVSIDFIRASNLPKNASMTALYSIPIQGLVLTSPQEKHHGSHHDAETIQEGALGPRGMDVGSFPYKDNAGRTYSGHWFVPPGRQVNHTRVSSWLNLSSDVTVHYITLHVHPFAETVELRDLTIGEEVFHGKVKNLDSGTGLFSVDALTSRAGIVMFRGHDYELITHYNNTSTKFQSAMSVMFLYARDDGLSGVR